MKRMKQEKFFYDDSETRGRNMQMTGGIPEMYSPIYLNGQLWMMDPEINGRIYRR